MNEKNYLQWLESDTKTVWWHDSAEKGLAETAFKNGATGMTTNPLLMAAALYSDRSSWTDISNGIDALAGDEKALELEKRIGGYYCGILEPIWKKGEWGKGGVCAQVSPCRIGDADLMLAQMKTIAAFAPNIFVKLPATKTGIKVFEEGIALGFNVVATVGFTVPQALAVAQAHVRGAEKARANGLEPGKGAAVLMVGRLDDYIRDVVHDNALDIAESDIIQCGLACAKKAYDIYRQRNYPTMIMTAACRGINHVTELAGAEIIMSVSPAIEEAVLKANPKKTERIDVPINPETLEKLLTVPEFAKAYNENGMTQDEFITYGPTNRTATQFVESGWNKLISF